MSAGRPTVDGVAQIFVGDSTSHGGVVMTGETRDTWNGIATARVTSDVFCPKCKPHKFKIIQGVPNNCTYDNLEITLDGYMTSCGATLIAKAAPVSTQAIAKKVFDGTAHDEQIRALDEKTGEPIAGIPYYIETQSGDVYHGYADEDGLCIRVFTENSEDMSVWFGKDALEKIEKYND